MNSTPDLPPLDTGTRLLIIDDDRKLCRLLSDYLQPLGYVIDVAHDGVEGLDRAIHGKYAAIILDVMLPGMSGFDVLRELRRESQTPVLMLTALGDEPDRIAGLEVGADDYLPKTFSTRELLARLRALVRRSYIREKSAQLAQPDPVSVGRLWMDPASHQASLNDRPLDLTTLEYALLLSLSRNAGRVRTRDQLLEEAADRNLEAFDRSIDVHISSIRKKLGDDPRKPKFIETIRGVGYRLLKPGQELGGDRELGA